MFIIISRLRILARSFEVIFEYQSRHPYHYAVDFVQTPTIPALNFEHPMHVFIVTQVKFCVGNLPGKEHSQLNKAEHSYFVNAGTISCVIINAEHYNAAADGGTVATVSHIFHVLVITSD